MKIGKLSEASFFFPHFLTKHFIRSPVFLPSRWEKYRGRSLLISSPSKYGIDTVTGTWAFPLAISFGFIKDRPVVRNNQIVIRNTYNLTLNFDRRVLAGAQAGRFFKSIIDNLENAETIMKPYLL